MICLLALLLAGAYQPAPENLKAREWFQEARFGLFIHWGLFSALERGEMAMDREQIPIAAYERVPQLFSPALYNPSEWVALARQAGMRYITITAKHHDGFALWSTRQTPWNIVDATPYRRDAIAMLAEECRKQNIKLFFYYSQLDWIDPDYFPRGRTGLHAGRPNQGNFTRYLDFIDRQLRELLTDYGPIGGIWFDGMWDKPLADWRLPQTYALIHSLQPAALIGNNHGGKPHDGEDFQIFHDRLPPNAGAGLPAESTAAISGSWGYDASDRKFRSSPELVRQLVRAAGLNSNFLLNIAPMPSGQIPAEVSDRLKELGEWTAKYGETIYGTRGGPLPPQPWGVTTQTSSKIYVHVLDFSGDWLPLPDIAFRKAVSFGDAKPLETRKSADGVAVRLPRRHPIDSILVLEK